MFFVPPSNNQKLIRQGYNLTFHPSENCRFSAITYYLQSSGINRSAETSRHELVTYLIKDPVFGGTNFVPDFLDIGWED